VHVGEVKSVSMSIDVLLVCDAKFDGNTMNWGENDIYTTQKRKGVIDGIM